MHCKCRATDLFSTSTKWTCYPPLQFLSTGGGTADQWMMVQIWWIRCREVLEVRGLKSEAAMKSQLQGDWFTVGVKSFAPYIQIWLKSLVILIIALLPADLKGHCPLVGSLKYSGCLPQCERIVSSCVFNDGALSSLKIFRHLKKMCVLFVCCLNQSLPHGRKEIICSFICADLYYELANKQTLEGPIKLTAMSCYPAHLSNNDRYMTSSCQT